MFTHRLSLCLFLILNISACGGGSTDSNVPSAPLPRSNVVPVADAGEDQVTDVDTLVELDAGKSHDDDGQSLSYYWAIISKPESSSAVLQDETSIKPSIIVDKQGPYEFELRVHDGEVQSEPDSVVVEVRKLPLDCNNLDPDKIYLQATLQKDIRYAAIADPSDPYDFCVGFNSSHIIEGQISSTGRYIYSTSSGDDKTILSLTSDQLIKSSEGYWEYPATPTDNDDLIHMPTERGCALGVMKVIPGFNEVIYSCPNRIFHRQNHRDYYDIGSTSINELLTIFDDGSLLVYEFWQGLVFVSPEFNETVIPLPFETPWTYYYGPRQHVDKVTGSKSVWLAYFKQNEPLDSLVRLTVDVDNLEVKVDGVFADLPDQFVPDHRRSKFDAQGNLWQIGHFEGEPKDEMIVKRPIKTSTLESKVIYRYSNYEGSEVFIETEENCAQFPSQEGCDDGFYRWYQHDNLFLKIDGFSALITGT
jgi:hypothetical protein